MSLPLSTSSGASSARSSSPQHRLAMRPWRHGPPASAPSSRWLWKAPAATAPACPGDCGSTATTWSRSTARTVQHPPVPPHPHLRGHGGPLATDRPTARLLRTWHMDRIACPPVLAAVRAALDAVKAARKAAAHTVAMALNEAAGIHTAFADTRPPALCMVNVGGARIHGSRSATGLAHTSLCTGSHSSSTARSSSSSTTAAPTTWSATALKILAAEAVVPQHGLGGDQARVGRGRADTGGDVEVHDHVSCLRVRFRSPARSSRAAAGGPSGPGAAGWSSTCGCAGSFAATATARRPPSVSRWPGSCGATPSRSAAPTCTATWFSWPAGL